MTVDHRSPVDVFAVLRQDDQVLLTRRAGDIPGTGQWALPSGRLEAGEDVVSAVRRELAEELGIAVLEQDVTCFGVSHARPPDGHARLGLGFAISNWSGELRIREPEKCSQLQWHALVDLPEPTMGYTRIVLDLYRGTPVLVVRGWPRNR